METRIDLKKKFLMLLVIMCLVLTTSCSLLTGQNPNVKTPLDAAKITYDASCGWYIGVYSDVVILNQNIHLNEESATLLRNEINPAMDKYKHMLINYGTLIEQVESGEALMSIAEAALELKAGELDMLKRSIIGLLLTINQLQLIEGE